MELDLKLLSLALLAITVPGTADGAVTTENLLLNSGAEAGDLRGWFVSGGDWWARSAGKPREGEWYFETDSLSNLITTGLYQWIDVRHLNGRIEDVTFSVSVAGEAGLAQAPITGETWTSQASTFASFYDYELRQIPISLLGTGGVPDGNFVWSDHYISWSLASEPGWLEDRQRIAYIRVGLSTVWINEVTRHYEDPPLDSIVRLPITRFDNTALTVTISEPSQSGSVFDNSHYLKFADCLLGPDHDRDGSCAPFDLDSSGSIDLVDVARMQHIFGILVPPGMVFIAGGPSQMGDSFGEGSSTELPVHTTYIKSFYIDAHEVTNAQYVAALNWAFARGDQIVLDRDYPWVMQAGPSPRKYLELDSYDSDSSIYLSDGVFFAEAGREEHPVAEVSWWGAIAFCNWRSAREGRPLCYDLLTGQGNSSCPGYRLPTEAEWEKAARGGNSGHRFAWADSDTIDHARANFRSNPSNPYDVSVTNGYHPDFSTGSFPYTSPVGYFAPNGYGLYDMTGNVWEWCHDKFEPEYYSVPRASQPNPVGPLGSYTGQHLIRGCSFYSSSEWCRVAYRQGFYYTNTAADVGFRCVLGTR